MLTEAFKNVRVALQQSAADRTKVAALEATVTATAESQAALKAYVEGVIANLPTGGATAEQIAKLQAQMDIIVTGLDSLDDPETPPVPPEAALADGAQVGA